MAIVPLDQVWVDANFKEPQLAAMRAGQPVTLKADLYGNKVLYHGTVAGFGAGTGSAFALLPAQNATGNWIKIVQRVPVRIALDPNELAAHPLQIGLSMQVDVDTRNREGARLPQPTLRASVDDRRVRLGRRRRGAAGQGDHRRQRSRPRQERAPARRPRNWRGRLAPRGRRSAPHRVAAAHAVTSRQ